MTLFIVTKSLFYYPEDGCGDWRSIHTSLHEAEAAAGDLIAEGPDWSGFSVNIIAASPVGFETLGEFTHAADL